MVIKRETKFPGGARGEAYHAVQRQKMETYTKPIIDHLTKSGPTSIAELAKATGRTYLSTYFAVQALPSIVRLGNKSGRSRLYCLKDATVAETAGSVIPKRTPHTKPRKPKNVANAPVVTGIDFAKPGADMAVEVTIQDGKVVDSKTRSSAAE